MKCLTLIGLLGKTIYAAAGGSVILLTTPEVEKASDPSSVCYANGYKPLMLRTQDVEPLRQKLLRSNVKYAFVAGWNGVQEKLVLGAEAGTVTPFVPALKTCSVLCVAKKAPEPCALPCPPAKKCPIAPLPCAQPTVPCIQQVCPPACPPLKCPIAPLPPFLPPCGPCPPGPCWPPRVLADKEICPPLCCVPKRCIRRRKERVCESPCVVNYNPRKVYIIDEKTVFCGPFLRIIETRCKRFGRERIFTISKLLPPFVPVPFPSILRHAALLHRILCEARDRFGVCGCVCMFIDYYNNIYIAVDCEYYRVVIRRPQFPWRPGFRSLTPFGGFDGFSGSGFGPDGYDGGMCPPRGTCSPCGPVTKCRPWRRTDACGRPCPSDFVFCKIRCEEMTHIKRRGLFAVLFSRPREC